MGNCADIYISNIRSQRLILIAVIVDAPVEAFSWRPRKPETRFLYPHQLL